MKQELLFKTIIIEKKGGIAYKLVNSFLRHVVAWKGHVHWSSAQILLSRGVSNDSNIKRCWKINFCDIWRSSFREKWLYPFRRWVSVTSSRCLHSGGLYLITNILKTDRDFGCFYSTENVVIVPLYENKMQCACFTRPDL